MARREYPDRNKRTGPAISSDLDRTMQKDRRGRTGIRPARAVKLLAGEATASGNQTKLNELIKVLQDGGFLDGGR